MFELWTIGYGNETLREILSRLTTYSIECLVDVRSVPYSKWQSSFNRPNLQPRLEARGIEYRWFGKTLGGRPRDKSCIVDGRLDPRECEKHDWYRRGIADLVMLAYEVRTAVLCSEIDAQRCHRGYTISDTLMRRDEECRIRHINRHGGYEYHDTLFPPKTQRMF